MMGILVIVAAAVGSAYLDVRKLPKGGNIQVLDPETGEPIEFEDEGVEADGSWRFNWREELQKWLYGKLP
jgi:hypothetical protein